jgi:hypothetical protein
VDFDFSQAMKERSDAELIKIVKISKDDYQQEAILAAEAEIVRRNISREEIEKLTHINTIQKSIEEKKANEPLDLHWKILTFIFPIVFTIILSGYYKGDGYDKKARDLVKWTLFGFGFYFLFFLIISIF